MFAKGGASSASASLDHSLFSRLCSLFWIVMVALATRILVIFLFHTYRFGAGQPYTYGYEMGRIGRSIAQGYGFGNIYYGHTGPTSWEPPVYPFVVGCVFRVFGIYSQLSAVVLLAINSIFSALTCVFIYLTAKRCFGERAAIASAWVWTLYPLAIYWSATWIWETALSTFLLTALFWLTLTMGERQGTKPWIVFGLLWGLAALSNPSLISFLPASGLWALRQYVRSARPWLAGVVVASLFFFACLAPWQIRNYRTFGHFFFVRGDFGMILRMGNGPEARGAGLIGLIPSRNPAEYARYVNMGEHAYAAAQGLKAMRFIRENPGRFLILCLKRVFFYWSGNPRSSLVQVSVLVNIFEMITSTLCFWGLARAFRQRIPGAWLFFWLMLLFPLIYYITFPNIRYREPIEPFMIILTVFLITGPQARKISPRAQNWWNAQRRAL
jgi:4-amino-4-deoxy-L-arabinose transferase-like glycosyltransferase